MSPQIVTETIYALAISRPAPNFIPTEVHIITTGVGAARAMASLLPDGQGWLRKLCDDYALPNIQFDKSTIHVISSSAGLPLDDIRTIEDNQLAADFVTARIREWTSDPNCSLHVSIAGGRKTMGFFLGNALSLYGRQQDRLSHVLVSDPFESCATFYYPTPASSEITLRDGRIIDAKDAVVTLADLPFVSLRHGLPQELLTANTSFSESIEAARIGIEPASLQLNLVTRVVRAAGKTFQLPRAELALLSLFARRALNAQPPLAAPNKELEDKKWADDYLEELRLIATSSGDLDKTEKALRHGMDGGYFSARLSKLRNLLKCNLGNAAHPFLISDSNTRPRRFYLDLEAQAIRYTTSEPELNQTIAQKIPTSN